MKMFSCICNVCCVPCCSKFIVPRCTLIRVFYNWCQTLQLASQKLDNSHDSEMLILIPESDCNWLGRAESSSLEVGLGWWRSVWRRGLYYRGCYTRKNTVVLLHYQLQFRRMGINFQHFRSTAQTRKPKLCETCSKLLYYSHTTQVNVKTGVATISDYIDLVSVVSYCKYFAKRIQLQCERASQGGTIIYCLYTFPLNGKVPSDPCIITLLLCIGKAVSNNYI